MDTGRIPFNKPYMTGKELYHIAQAHFHGMLAGDGPFTKKCHIWMQEYSGAAKVLLTHSCTAALEMAAMLIDTQKGDEIIMPSFTFVSTANAFVLRGGTPVFVDIRADTLNLDERQIEEAITPHTKAIVPVHYAGVACEMDAILAIARKYSLKIIEDSAQGVMSTYKGRALGGLGDYGAYSFHETKNVISGEGGALLIRDESNIQRAEILREKGTDRSRFFRGEIDKYTWQEPGSSFLPGELIAAFLWAQLEEAQSITSERMRCWQTYHTLLAPLEYKGLLRRPVIPDICAHNAHMYYILLAPRIDRQAFLEAMKRNNIYPVFHYVPLHTAPAGQQLGRTSGNLPITEDVSRRLVRLPLWVGLSVEQQEYIVQTMTPLLHSSIR